MIHVFPKYIGISFLYVNQVGNREENGPNDTGNKPYIINTEHPPLPRTLFIIIYNIIQGSTCSCLQHHLHVNY